jgi:hypothetical protein
VVITGLGVVAPNGVVLTPLPTQLKNFWDTERSRFRAIAFFVSNLRKPEISEELSLQYFTELELRNLLFRNIIRMIAGMDAWKMLIYL